MGTHDGNLVFSPSNQPVVDFFPSAGRTHHWNLIGSQHPIQGLSMSFFVAWVASLYFFV
jgi:hypothetical protein